ncbi:MAG TPA: PhnA domain-containing protein [Arachidicoccus sp.]
MTLAQLQQRSNNVCELCAATGNLNIYDVPPTADNISDREIYICDKCLVQIEKKEELDGNHWQCLTISMWSETPAIQVVAWRMLNRLRNESWAADNLDMMYLDDAAMEWAKATGDHENDASVDLHRDSNGAVLNNGDSVVLTKSLDVKGSSVNARLGTVVKNIRLDANDMNYIEGKIDGQSIMIKTMYVRKQGV